MLNSLENTLLVLGVVVASLACLCGLNRIWPAARRREHNDLIGWQLSILGTTYAVILGFMLYTVWTDYGLAEANVEAEASALTNVYELARGLPEAKRARVQELTRHYGDLLVEKDWPEMERRTVPLDSGHVNEELWRAVTDGAGAAGSTVEDHVLGEVELLTAHRQLRLLQSARTLPTVLWWVLTMGAVVTLLSSCLFGSLNTRVHLVQVGSLSLLIALVLSTIADINRPFQGAVRVGTASVERARDAMRAAR